MFRARPRVPLLRRQLPLYATTVALAATLLCADAPGDVGAFRVPGRAQSANVTPYVELLEGETGHLDIDTVTSPEFSGVFTHNDKPYVNRGIRREPVWMRVTLAVPDRQPRVIEFTNPRLGSVELFVPDGKGGWTRKVAGTFHPFSIRELPFPSPAFQVQLAPNTPTTFYARVQNHGSFRLRVRLWKERAYRAAADNRGMFHALVIGALIAIGLYNLFVFLGLRELGYFYHALLILCFVLAEMALNGAAYKYLWRDSPWWADRSVTVLFMLVLALAVVFVNTVLETRRYAPRVNRFLNAWALAAFAAAAFAFTDTYAKFVVSHTLTTISPFIGLYAAVVVMRHGNRSAASIIFAFSTLFIGTLIFALMGFGVLPTNAVTENMLSVGFLTATLLWSLALTDRVKAREREQREVLQEQAAHRALQLNKALNEVQALHQLLPICSHCKKIRDDQGYWSEVEQYITAQSGVGFSHSLCPECAHTLYPGFAARHGGEVSPESEVAGEPDSKA